MTPTDTDGLLKDAGGARPASDVVNHCVDCCCARSWSALGVTEYDGKSIPEHITRLRDSEALVRGKIVEQMIEIARLTKLETECWSNPEAWMKWCDVRVLERAERAEAELDTQNRALAQCRALLKQEIDDVVPLRDKVAALEAERDAWKSKLLAEEVEHDATMAERDALHADAVAIFEWMNRKGGMGLDVHRRIDTFLATWSKP